MLTTAEKIRLLARGKGLPLSELAKNIGVTKVGFYKMLKNNAFKQSTLEKIASVLEVSINKLESPEKNVMQNNLTGNEMFLMLAPTMAAFSKAVDRIKNLMDEASNNDNIDKEKLIAKSKKIVDECYAEFRDTVNHTLI